MERPDELDGALKEAFHHDGPAVIDVLTAREEILLPPKLMVEQVKGFTLYATRTILSGRGTEILELARTNLRELSVE